MALTKITSSIVDSSITKTVFLSQSEYDALSSKDTSTLYIITD
jgi:hypothetical protein